uniref:Putative intergrin alpha chain protein n=1 Tax=Trypanosoma congolense (strain IL3000) TaxID=1068625 RepID=G0UNG6_TRYCI|nr:putative intergrin alpha chain protein [Trypanosoma congolense IL3000]
MALQTNCYSMRPAFQLHLNKPLMEGLAAIGRFDGVVPSIVCATLTGQLVVHTSGERDNTVGCRKGVAETPLRVLNFGQTPRAIAAGCIGATFDGRAADTLFFCDSSSLLAYDVERNSEYFFNDIQQGVTALACGVARTTVNGAGDLSPLVVVGGECVISGFDSTGSEVLSTVVGDRVTALMVMPWEGNDPCAAEDNPTSGSLLVAATDDFELRVFDGGENVTSVGISDRVNKLLYSGVPGKFAYLSNSGTIGVYDRSERLLRVKKCERPVSAAFCDVDMDGVPELVVGWSDGHVEIRSGDGESDTVLFRETFESPVSAVLADDYRQNGQPLPIICTADGTVRGLHLSDIEVNREDIVARRDDTLRFDALMLEKQTLEDELLNIKEQLSRRREGRTDLTMPCAGTTVEYSMQPNAQTGKLDVVFTVTETGCDTIIHSCILKSETIFPGKEHVLFMLQDPLPTLVCELDVPYGPEITVSASVVVGCGNATCYQIHETDVVIPKFVMCRPWPNEHCTDPCTDPTGSVSLSLPEDFDFRGVSLWLRETFALPPERLPDTASDFFVSLVHMRDNSGVVINGLVRDSQLQICSNSMELCCVLVESLATSYIEEASSQCDFPEDFRELEKTAELVLELDGVRQRMSDDIADTASNIKPLLMRAEDSRMLCDIANMRRYYAQLYELDKELIGENLKLCNNFKELKSALKQLNAFILKASRLRIGKAKAQLVAACRECVKVGDMRSLINILRTG